MKLGRFQRLLVEASIREEEIKRRKEIKEKERNKREVKKEKDLHEFYG